MAFCYGRQAFKTERPDGKSQIFLTSLLCPVLDGRIYFLGQQIMDPRGAKVLRQEQPYYDDEICCGQGTARGRHTIQTHLLQVIGLPELRMLIDYDILHPGSHEVAEVHRLAWALGRICALRPGSVGWSRIQDDGMLLQ